MFLSSVDNDDTACGRYFKWADFFGFVRSAVYLELVTISRLHQYDIIITSEIYYWR